MKARDWNNGLNYIDPDLVEEFVNTGARLELRRRRRRRGMLWLRVGAIAACLAILVASPFAIIPLLHPQDPVVTPLPGEIPENPPPPTQNPGVTPPPSETDHPTGPDNPPPPIAVGRVQTPSATPFYYGSKGSIGGSTSGAHSVDGISVTARYVEALPDTYLFFDSWKQIEFRILRMETVKPLNGVGMVDEFYYMIPVQYMTDFSLYDCFVLSDMGQYSTNAFSVLYNVTDGCAESMDLILFGCHSMEEFSDYLSGYYMKAFDETGTIDLRLWQSTEAWQKESAGAIEHYGSTYTLVQAEEYELSPDANRDYLYVYKPESITDVAAKELADLITFKNGIFVPSGSGRLLFGNPNAPTEFSGRRYINGFATNERLWISGAGVSEDGKAVTRHTTARFNEEDMNRLPDLSSAVASVTTALEAGQITPPHIQDLSSKKLSEWAGLGVFAWYAKTDNGVIGVVRVNWRYETTDVWAPPEVYFDDAYYIIEYGTDKAVPIDRDALLNRIGDCESVFVFEDEYNENGKDLSNMAYY